MLDHLPSPQFDGCCNGISFGAKQKYSGNAFAPAQRGHNATARTLQSVQPLHIEFDLGADIIGQGFHVRFLGGVVGSFLRSGISLQSGGQRVGQQQQRGQPTPAG